MRPRRGRPEPGRPSCRSAGWPEAGETALRGRQTTTAAVGSKPISVPPRRGPNRSFGYSISENFSEFNIVDGTPLPPAKPHITMKYRIFLYLIQLQP
jgi:hypothetical protein